MEFRHPLRFIYLCYLLFLPSILYHWHHIGAVSIFGDPNISERFSGRHYFLHSINEGSSLVNKDNTWYFLIFICQITNGGPFQC